MQRVIAYVDGFNLYYGIRSQGWKKYYWLNVQEMIRLLLKPDQTLTVTKYFTSAVSQPPDKHKRQTTYLEALKTLSGLQVVLGHYLGDTVICRSCGHSYVAFHEKMTDVNIAVEMLSDAYQQRFDVAMLVSADGDLVGLVRSVKQLFPESRVILALPPGRDSRALRHVATGFMFIDRSTLAQSQLPEEIVRPDGYVLRRPAEWY